MEQNVGSFAHKNVVYSRMILIIIRFNQNKFTLENKKSNFFVIITLE